MTIKGEQTLLITQQISAVILLRTQSGYFSFKSNLKGKENKKKRNWTLHKYVDTRRLITNLLLSTLRLLSPTFSLLLNVGHKKGEAELTALLLSHCHARLRPRLEIRQRHQNLFRPHLLKFAW